MPLHKIELPAGAKGFLTAHQEKFYLFKALRKFHRWMKRKNLALKDLKPKDLEAFCDRGLRKKNKKSVARYHKWIIFKYLTWLYENSHSSLKPQDLETYSRRLPKTVVQFVQSQTAASILKTRPQIKRLVRFHRWMNQEKMTLKTLTSTQLRTYVLKTSKHFKRDKSYAHRKTLQIYLAWLSKKNQIRFDPHINLNHSQVVLPEGAAQFIEILEITRRPNTVNHYRGALCNLHGFLQKQQMGNVEGIQRKHIIQWLHFLKNEGLQAKSRVLLLLNVRTYLRWLHEENRLQLPVSHLIESQDFPKIPQYLPRPLPLEIDRRLQDFLATSQDPDHQALLLMRKTGIRVGELSQLEYHCIRTDYHTNAFLKVPLGKLYNERLVPLDPKTCTLIETLQSHSRSKTWLIETPRGDPKTPKTFMYKLRKIAKQIHPHEPIQTHRLRHTYATEMLANGMSLVSVMKLLGHRHPNMTLQYTAITQETVKKEYDQALKEIEKKYRLPKKDKTSVSFEPLEAIIQLKKWLQKHHATQNPISNLLKRLDRIKENIKKFQTTY